MSKKNKENSKPKLLFGLILIALGLLLFFSLLSYTIDDIQTLKRAQLTFSKIITLQFPFTGNMVGPFGAIFSYLSVFLFSKFVSFIIAIFLFISSFFLIFGYKLKQLNQKLFLVLLFLFSGILFYLSIGGNFEIKTGIVFIFLVEGIFFPIFKNLGSAILFGLTILGTLLFIFEPKKVTAFLVKLLKIFHLISEKKKKKKSIQKKPSISYLDKDDNQDVSEDSEEMDENEQPKFENDEKTKSEISEDEYILPNFNDILKDSSSLTKQELEAKEREIQNSSKLLQSKLAEFGIEGEVTNVNVGPIITQYEVRPAPGMKISKFTALSDDLALAMKASKIRIVAPIPGKDTIGFEIPNRKPNIIRLKDVLNSEEMKSNPSPTLIALGKDITGKPYAADLKDLRHLLVAGLTGSGKSVCLNVIINSILYRATPEQVRFIFFDPKKIELSIYEKIPHLIKEVITETKDVLYLLNWAVVEMERRYDTFAEHNVRDIDGYNDLVRELSAKDGELEPLPYLIVVVDELADLMQSMANEIERPIRRLSGMARAVGIYLVFATQRPSVDVVNGMIKANFPSRISFQVYSKTDSRTVLDVNGADKLLGEGDMLFSPLGKKPPIRVHGSLVTTEEVKKLVKHLAKYPQPEISISLPSNAPEQDFEYDDEYFPEAVRIVVERQFASVSMMQRKFRIGYARAGRLIDAMERAGIVGNVEGSKARKVLIKKDELEKLGF
ncbi:MAG: cell division protein FtsK [Candidatus Cloacimonetes bacterium]|nr:cell division protein FtsK [Candidatus Cloacimonadota bacterium]